VRVSDDELAMQLVGDGVKLVNADELVTAGGGRVASTTIDRASRAFVDTFTRKYPELADRVPVYAQLRNLIDMSIAAAYIQDRDLYAKAGWRMDVLGDEEALPVEVHAAPKTVETAVNALWKGRTLMTPIGGGVEMRPREALRPDRILPDEEDELSSTYSKIELPALEAGRWWWD
jgi:hypothetical protein